MVADAWYNCSGISHKNEQVRKYDDLWISLYGFAKCV